jgi:hypothetical protein
MKRLSRGKTDWSEPIGSRPARALGDWQGDDKNRSRAAQNGESPVLNLISKFLKLNEQAHDFALVKSIWAGK